MGGIHCAYHAPLQDLLAVFHNARIEVLYERVADRGGAFNAGAARNKGRPLEFGSVDFPAVCGEIPYVCVVDCAASKVDVSSNRKVTVFANNAGRCEICRNEVGWRGSIFSDQLHFAQAIQADDDFVRPIRQCDLFKCSSEVAVDCFAYRGEHYFARSSVGIFHHE